jgi:hypothetical protein
MQGREINPGRTRAPVNYRSILEVPAKDRVRGKEVPVELVEVWLMPASPFSRCQACRDRQDGGWNGSGGPLCCVFATRLQHRLSHFLHEQGNAVGTLDDVLADVDWQRLLPTTRSIMASISRRVSR